MTRCVNGDARIVSFRICNAVTKSHPQRSDVYKSDLDKTLPSVQETQAAFVKLKQLCMNGKCHSLLRVRACDGRAFRVVRGTSGEAVFPRAHRHSRADCDSARGSAPSENEA